MRLKRSILGADHRAYVPTGNLLGLTGFRRPAEFDLYWPRLFFRWPALDWPVGNTELNDGWLGAGGYITRSG